MQKSKEICAGSVGAQTRSPVLLLSWVPLIGDLLCVAAGWLRVNLIAALAFMAAGKFLRYCGHRGSDRAPSRLSVWSLRC